jgi:hypothetical protein
VGVRGRKYMSMGNQPELKLRSAEVDLRSTKAATERRSPTAVVACYRILSRPKLNASVRDTIYSLWVLARLLYWHYKSVLGIGAKVEEPRFAG